jgi:hypothetical protein
MGEQHREPTQYRAAQARHAARQQHLQRKRKNKGQQRWQFPITEVIDVIDEPIPAVPPLTKPRNFNRRTSNQNDGKAFTRKSSTPSSPVTEVVAEIDEPLPPLNPPSKSWNREAFHDKVRASIAIIFVAAFVGTIVVSFIMAYVFSPNQVAWPNIKDLIQILITAESALLGAAMGFYFGEKIGRLS